MHFFFMWRFWLVNGITNPNTCYWQHTHTHPHMHTHTQSDEQVCVCVHVCHISRLFIAATLNGHSSESVSSYQLVALFCYSSHNACHGYICIFPLADVSVAHKNALTVVSIIKWHKLVVIYGQHNVWSSCLMTILNNRKSFVPQIVTRIFVRVCSCHLCYRLIYMYILLHVYFYYLRLHFIFNLQFVWFLLYTAVF